MFHISKIKFTSNKFKIPSKFSPKFEKKKHYLANQIIYRLFHLNSIINICFQFCKAMTEKIKEEHLSLFLIIKW